MRRLVVLDVVGLTPRLLPHMPNLRTMAERGFRDWSMKTGIGGYIGQKIALVGGSLSSVNSRYRDCSTLVQIAL